MAWIECPAGYNPYAGSETDLANAKDNSGRLLTTAEKAGYACMNSNGMYLNQMSDPTIANLSASYDRSHQIGYVAFAGAAGALLLLDGWMKLLALPLALYGLTKEMTGGM